MPLAKKALLKAAKVLSIVLLIAAYTCPFSSVAYAGANYSKSAELPPLRISLSQLQSIVSKAHAIATKANSSIPFSIEALSLADGGVTVKIEGYEFNSSNYRLPDVIYSFDYRIANFKETPIENITIHLADNYRIITVDGQSPDQVDALFSVTRDELLNISSYFGGLSTRYNIAFVGIVVFLFWISLIYASVRTRSAALVPPILILTVFIGASIILSYWSIFVGFSASQGSASIIVRYSAEIGFWGLICSIIALPLSLLPLCWPSRR